MPPQALSGHLPARVSRCAADIGSQGVNTTARWQPGTVVPPSQQPLLQPPILGQACQTATAAREARSPRSQGLGPCTPVLLSSEATATRLRLRHYRSSRGGTPRKRREQPARAPGDPEEAEKRGRAIPVAPGPAARSDAPRSALWGREWPSSGDARVQRGWRRRSSHGPIGRRGKHPKTRPFPRPALSPPPPAEIGRFSCTCARRLPSLLRRELCCPSEIRLISFTCCFVSGSSLSLVRHSGQRKSSLW